MYENSKKTSQSRIPQSASIGTGNCKLGMEPILRIDVSSETFEAFRHDDHSMQIDSYDVDAIPYRRFLHRQKGEGGRISKKCQTVENVNCSSQNAQRVGNGGGLVDNSRGKHHSGGGVMYRIAGRRSGQALLEFAVLIPLFLILIGVTISFGLFFYQGNVLQQAVDVAAQEISRMPFAPTMELGLGRLDKCNLSDLACQTDEFKNQIYDEKHLVILDSMWDASTSFGGDFQAYVATLPLLNRLLIPVMIRDNLGEMTRYPGALVTNDAGELTVLIPIVAYNYNGVIDGFYCSGETILEWVAPVEEIRVDHDDDGSTPNEGPFRLVSNSESGSDIESFTRGMVAIRINYPAQSTALINRTDIPSSSNPDGVRGQVIVVANDQAMTDGNTGCYSLVVDGLPDAGSSADPFGGRYGLGSLGVLKGNVRPFRKVMTFQAIYRREVFADE